MALDKTPQLHTDGSHLLAYQVINFHYQVMLSPLPWHHSVFVFILQKYVLCCATWDIFKVPKIILWRKRTAKGLLEEEKVTFCDVRFFL